MGKGRVENLTNKGKGRPRGARNKFTSLKQAFLDVFERLENTQGKNLYEWAEKNQRDFYNIIARMLPKTVEEKTEHALTTHTRELLDRIAGQSRDKLPSEEEDED